MSHQVLREIAEQARLDARERRSARGPRAKPRGPLWDRALIVEAIREWARQTGAPPVSSAWGSHSLCITQAALKWRQERPRWPTDETVRRHLGSWPAALRAAGFEPSRRELELPFAERVEAARSMAAAGTARRLIADHLGATVETVGRYLNAGYCPACAAPVLASTTGFCLACLNRARNVALYTRDELLARLREWHARYGDAPTSSQWAAAPDGASTQFEEEFPYWPSSAAVQVMFGSWRAGLQAAGLQPHTREPWTRRDVVDALTRAAARLGRSPGVADARLDPTLPFSAIAAREFGSWSAALAAAGLPPHRGFPRRRWDKESVLAAISDWAAEHDGEAPRYGDFEHADRAHWPTPQTVARHIGSWDAALQAAGLTPAPEWTDARIIRALQTWAEQHGRSPAPRDWSTRVDERPSQITVSRRFGCWNAALRAAGLPPPPRFTPPSRPRGPTVSAEEIVAALRSAAAQGVLPTMQKWRSTHQRPGVKAIVARFGSWTAALDAAGVRRAEVWSREAILAGLDAWVARHGRPPKPADWKRAAPGKHPSSRVAISRFGSWTAMLKASGHTHQQPAWPAAKIISALTQWTATHGRQPTQTDWQRTDANATRPTAAIVAAQLGSWNAMFAAAGLQPNRRYWTRHEALDAYRAFDERHGRPPNQQEIANATKHSLPSNGTITRHFASRAAFYDELGFAPDVSQPTGSNTYHVPRVTDDEILDRLRAHASRSGHAPTTTQWKASGGRPVAAAIRRRFGSWEAAIGAAGLQRAPLPASPWTDTAILEALQRFHRLHGCAPHKTDYDRPELPPLTRIRAAHGSTTAALAKIGVQPNRARATNQAMLDALRNHADEHGRPTAAAWRATRRSPSADAIIQRFGSWRAALTTAGLDEPAPPPQAAR